MSVYLCVTRMDQLTTRYSSWCKGKRATAVHVWRSPANMVCHAIPWCKPPRKC